MCQQLTITFANLCNRVCLLGRGVKKQSVKPANLHHEIRFTEKNMFHKKVHVSLTYCTANSVNSG